MQNFKKHIASFLLLAGLVTQTSAQVKDSTGLSIADDPIAAMLDSLAQYHYFEKEALKPYSKAPRNLIPQDSVPRFDEAVYAARLAKLDAQSPFDLIYNDAVKGYIELYAVRKRELVSRVLALSQLYFPMFEQVLDRYNLPLELKYLAICESALNPSARSRAGAVGLWQFMYGTGKMYGLKVSSYIDERSDPLQATIASCEYMKFLYDMFGDWQMVLAAYNAGPGSINKAIRRSGGKHTYWEIRPYLPRETQGYVPAFIAVNYVMNYAGEHNLYSATPKRTFIEVDTIAVQQQITFDQISNVLGISTEEIKYLNPCYKRNVIPLGENEKNTLCLPKSYMGSFITNETAIYNYLKKDTLSSQFLAAQQTMKLHSVRKGESLTAIARKYKCTVSEIMEWNGLRSKYVKPGKKLTVYVNMNPSKTNVAENKPMVQNQIAQASSTSTAVKPVAVKSNYYKVQKGDSLWKIAQMHNTTVDEIKKLNNFGADYKLIPGKSIQVAPTT